MLLFHTFKKNPINQTHTNTDTLKGTSPTTNKQKITNFIPLFSHMAKGNFGKYSPQKPIFNSDPIEKPQECQTNL